MRFVPRRGIGDILPMKAEFNPCLLPTFSFVFFRRGGRRGSTGSKQTSKGLFIFFSPALRWDIYTGQSCFFYPSKLEDWQVTKKTSSCLDLHFHAGRKVEFAQRIHRT